MNTETLGEKVILHNDRAAGFHLNQTIYGLAAVIPLALAVFAYEGNQKTFAIIVALVLYSVRVFYRWRRDEELALSEDTTQQIIAWAMAVIEYYMENHPEDFVEEKP